MTHLVYSTNDKNLKNRVINHNPNLNWFVTIQGSYPGLSLSLFHHNSLVQTINNHDSKASSHLIPTLDEMLKNHGCSRQQLSCIVVDQGPGAFTSLRVTIATVNGIHFATGIPLVGIHGLKGLLLQSLDYIKSLQQQPDYIVALLNAYNDDCYCIAANVQQGACRELFLTCESINTICTRIETDCPSGKMLFVGNSSLLHAEKLSQHFQHRIEILHDTYHQTLQSDVLGTLYLNDRLETSSPGILHPFYMKTQTFAVKRT